MKLLLTLCILASIAISQTKIINANKSTSKQELEKMLETEGAIANEDVNAMKVTSGDKKSKKTSSKSYNSDTYEDVAIYRLLLSNRKDTNIQYANINANLLNDNVSTMKEIKAKAKARADAIEKAKNPELEEDSIVSFTGYCSNRNEVNIEQIQGYSVLECSFDDNDFNIEEGSIMVSFIPIPNRNALIANPVYFQKGRRKLPIESGVILTVDRTSLNVANVINDKKLEKMTGKLLLASSQLALDSSVSYMQQKENSRKKEDLVYNNSVGGSQVVKTSNTESPKASDYLTNFGVQLTSAVINIAGAMMTKDNYPLFTVNKNAQFYVDFTIIYNKKNKKTIDYLKEDYSKIQEKETDGLNFNFKLPTVISDINNDISGN